MCESGVNRCRRAGKPEIQGFGGRMFNTETVPSRPLGRWDLDSMVETRCSCDSGREGCEENPEL